MWLVNLFSAARRRRRRWQDYEVIYPNGDRRLVMMSPRLAQRFCDLNTGCLVVKK
jgi:hypothetical protein